MRTSDERASLVARFRRFLAETPGASATAIAKRFGVLHVTVRKYLREARGEAVEVVTEAPKSALAEALAEAGKVRPPLAVPLLAVKLTERLPGAVVEPTPVRAEHHTDEETGATVKLRVEPKPTEKWRVVREGRVLALAPSEREAVDRALFLFGGR